MANDSELREAWRHLQAERMRLIKRLAIVLIAIAFLFALGFYFFPKQSVQPTAPARPHKVTLNWEKAARATSYNVYRRAYRGDTYTKLGNSATTSYEDPTALAAERYCYQITSVDSKGNESKRSKEICVTVPHP